MTDECYQRITSALADEGFDSYQINQLLERITKEFNYQERMKDVRQCKSIGEVTGKRKPHHGGENEREGHNNFQDGQLR